MPSAAKPVAVLLPLVCAGAAAACFPAACSG